MIRPTPLALLLFGLGILPCLLLLAWNRAWWPVSFDMSLFVLLALLADCLLLRIGGKAAAVLTVPERIYLGETTMIAVGVTLSAPLQRSRVEALPDLQGEVPMQTAQRAVCVAGAAGFSFPCRPRRRGRIVLAALWLRWQGPLRLARRSLVVADGRAIAVLPDIRGIPRIGLNFVNRQAAFGQKVQRYRGDGAEFETLREHAAGLDNRFIDWKRSARHRRLVSKEFRSERNHPVVLAFDTGHLMQEPINGIARLDHAIRAGLTLGWTALHGGDAVGSFAFDAAPRQYLEPARGLAGFVRLQRETVALDYHVTETNYTLGLAELSLRLKRRSLIVLFTEFVDTIAAELLVESLARVIRRHLILFVSFRDPILAGLREAPPEDFDAIAKAMIAHDFQRERAVLLERIGRLGVHCLDVSADSLVGDLLDRYLLVKERALL